MVEDTLPADELQALRQQGLISENEVACRQGDLLIAINVVTQDRRIINRTVTEGVSVKRLLKG
jgi:hypothetical protein